MRPSRSCVITPEEAITLDGLFWERVRRNPYQIAYEDFNVEHKNWRQYTWEHMGYEVRRWQKALEGEALKPGDRVAVMLRNSPQWVLCDQAALGLGLVVVPLYMGDRADNVAYVLKDCACRMLFLTDLPAWQSLDSVRESFSDLQKIITIEPLPPSFRLRSRGSLTLVRGCHKRPDRRGHARTRATLWQPSSIPPERRVGLKG